MLAALGLPRGWRMRLARAFGSAEMLKAALADLANPPKNGALPEPASALVAAGDLEGLAAHIAAGMAESGLSPSAGRTPEEIARRLVEKSELRSVRLSSRGLCGAGKISGHRRAARPVRRRRWTISPPAPACRWARPLPRFRRASKPSRGRGCRWRTIRYDAAFGRPLDYYTGLVFEISAGDGARPLVGGGRYDRLLTLLGAKQPIPGVGFSVWLDRIEALRGDAA